MPRIRPLGAALAFAASTSAATAVAQLPAGTVIDQQSTVASGPPITISETFDFVRQTFTPTAREINGFGITLTGPITTTTMFNVLIGRADGSVPPLLSRLYRIAPTANYGGFDAFFTTPAPLELGTQYVIALGLQTGSLTFLTGSGDPYAGGAVYVNGTEQPGQDLVFRTYAPAAVSTVAPEPGTFALAALGLGGATLLRRARRRAQKR